MELTKPCLLWTGPTNRHGYGQRTVGKRTASTHRWAWEAANGPLPKGLVLHHLCHQRACYEVSHLQPMTRSDHARLHAAEHGPKGATEIAAKAITCSKGHPFDKHDGKRRICTICRREINRRWMAKARAAKRQLEMESH